MNERSLLISRFDAARGRFVAVALADSQALLCSQVRRYTVDSCVITTGTLAR